MHHRHCMSSATTSLSSCSFELHCYSWFLPILCWPSSSLHAPWLQIFNPPARHTHTKPIHWNLFPKTSCSGPRFLAAKHWIFFFSCHRLLSISSFRSATFTEIMLTYLRTEIWCCRPPKHHHVGSGDDTLRRIMHPNLKLQKIFCFEKMWKMWINSNQCRTDSSLSSVTWFFWRQPPTNQ